MLEYVRKPTGYPQLDVRFEYVVCSNHIRLQIGVHILVLLCPQQPYRVSF